MTKLFLFIAVLFYFLPNASASALQQSALKIEVLSWTQFGGEDLFVIRRNDQIQLDVINEVECAGILLSDEAQFSFHLSDRDNNMKLTGRMSSLRECTALVASMRTAQPQKPVILDLNPQMQKISGYKIIR